MRVRYYVVSFLCVLILVISLIVLGMVLGEGEPRDCDTSLSYGPRISTGSGMSIGMDGSFGVGGSGSSGSISFGPTIKTECE